LNSLEIVSHAHCRETQNEKGEKLHLPITQEFF
jgi:hypothetical protein